MEENKVLRCALCFVGLVLGLAVCWQLFGGCGRTGGDGNDVGRTMGAVEADNLGAGRAVRDAGDAIDSGQRELGNALERLEDGEAIVEESRKRADCREAILEDCRRNLGRAKQIIADIERSNQKGKTNE